MNLKQTRSLCKEFGFNQEITIQYVWNTAYQLGRSRWYWGPAWFVSLCGWWNTKRKSSTIRAAAKTEQLP